MRKYLKIKYQTNEVNLAAAEGIITHSYFSCTSLLNETCSRKLTFPTGGGLILDVPLCEAENFDLCIFRTALLCHFDSQKK